MIQKFLRRLNALPTDHLFLPLFLGGLLFGLLAAWLKPYDGTPLANLVAAVILALWGAAGWVMFTRREMLQAGRRIRGRIPRFFGFLVMAVFWSLGVFALVLMAQGLAR